MAWTTKTGVECRNTSGFVTTDSGDTFLDGDGSSNLKAYPQSKTVNSNTFNIGYSSGSGADGARDRTTGVGAKLAGMHFKASGTATLKIQVGDAAGDYKVWAGFTDQGNGTGGTVGFTIRDTNGTIISQTGLAALTANQVYDVNGTLYATAAAWAATADTTGTSYSFTTSDTSNGNGGPFIYVDLPDVNARIAYIAFEYLGAGASDVDVDIDTAGAITAAGQTMTAEIAISAVAGSIIAAGQSVDFLIDQDYDINIDTEGAITAAGQSMTAEFSVSIENGSISVAGQSMTVEGIDVAAIGNNYGRGVMAVGGLTAR